MNDNELIKNEYKLAIKNFESEIGEIDKKYCTFAKIEIGFETVYTIGDILPKQYLRDIKLEEIVIK